jgi:hypothetical protein
MKSVKDAPPKCFLRVIIAGGRDFNDMAALERAVEASGFDKPPYRIDVVLSGAATGADKLGEIWADRKLRCCTRFKAEWDRYGKAAGPRRNMHMATLADALIALPGGRGTANMIEVARKMGLKVYVHAE